MLARLLFLLLLITPRLALANANFTSDWFTNNVKIWDKYKVDLKDKPNKKCLEMGSWEGRSAIYMAENYCNGIHSHVDCVDTWEGSIEHTTKSKVGLYERFLHNTKTYVDNKKIIPHRGMSKNVLLDFIHNSKQGADHQYDVIYIDASNLAADVLVDAVLAWELLKVGGIMIFDDYEGGDKSYAAPKPAIDGFLASYKTMYEVLHKGYQIHIKKIKDRPEIPDNAKAKE